MATATAMGTATAPVTGRVCISVEERLAAIQSVEAVYEALAGSGLSAVEANTALAASLAAMPEFSAAGVDTVASSVWARFVDGRLLIVANNRLPEPVSDSLLAEEVLERAGVTGRDGLRSARLAPSSERTELPGMDRVRLFHSFGPAFDQVQSPIDDLSEWFRAHGYEVVAGAEGDASVEMLRAIAGDGFFYLNTHGGRGVLRDSSTVFAVQTSTLVDSTREVSADIAEDLQNDLLVYMTAPNGTKRNGKPVSHTRYAITYRFVQKYMSFGERSIVFMNVCFSTYPNTWHETGTIPYVPDGAGDPYGSFMMGFGANAHERTVRFFPIVSAPYTDRLVVACHGGSTTDEDRIPFTVHSAILDPGGFLHLPTDTGLVIEAGRREKQLPRDTELVTVTLEWTEMKPFPAYDPGQPR